MAAQEINEFDIMRQRIKERAQQRGQQAQTGVNQNFASRGLLQSGAQIKAQERAAQDVATQAREEDRDVLVAEAQVNRAQREAEAGRQFQTSERLGTQQFAGEQAVLQREFAAKQARLAETFTSGENILNRDFTSGENILNRDFTRGENLLNRNQLDDHFTKTLTEQIAKRTQDAEQFVIEMDENKKTNIINTINALRTNGFNDVEINTILNSLPGMEQILNNTPILDTPQTRAAAARTAVNPVTSPAGQPPKRRGRGR